MSFANHHIDKVATSNSSIISGIFIVGSVAAFLAILSYKLTYRLVNWVNKLLTKRFNQLENASFLIKSVDLKIEDAKLLHRETQKELKRYRKLYTRLEKVKYFDNAYTYEIADKIMLSLYSIESHTRMCAFSETPPIDGDTDLINFASNLSLGSPQA